MNERHIKVWQAAILSLAISITAATANPEIPCTRAADGMASFPGMTNGVCQTYAVQTPGDSTACHWAFGYRSHEAIERAEEIWAHVSQCYPGTEQARDQIVNHPDSYLPRTWLGEKAARTVSVKDKAQLNKTLVFLRIEPLP